MKLLLALIGFFFLLATLGLAAFLWKVRKRMRQIRDAMQNGMNDEAFQRMADKNYWRKKNNEGPMFDEDYFKGDPDSWRRKQQQQQQQQQTRRTTRTAGGVTIIDDRDPNSRDKKIFTKDEGEYVDYKEE